ncbi:glycosyltransferase [Bradyrhizobium yuanmingense]|uniref:glycosyltransferase n=1 Tax=Bradyrhizobium yuanmingense TaxID=108015 RepID=UPI000FE352D0|nr:glycosyltransferase [Bradyrhizobium yuanmingense]TGN88566.1 glycosyltransferase [Bradyrhizobium yuanmingense]
MNILWISGRLPGPLFSGDALYSAGLIKALARMEDVTLCVLGNRRDSTSDFTKAIGSQRVTFVDFPPPLGSDAWSILSGLPKDAFKLATPDLQAGLIELLARDWDWIIVDHANSAGLLPTILARRGKARLCYIAHNAEGKIRPEIAASATGLLVRTTMRLDAEKYRRLEIAVVSAADSIICISDADVGYFSLAKNIQVVPPVYLGQSTPITIGASRPRRLLLLGSFEWRAKQRNLESIIKTVGPQLKKSDIHLDVVGAVPREVTQQVSSTASLVTFHGQVDDVRELFQCARGGLVAETLGGGFKLKVLDYAFQGLPIFGLRGALAGTTAEEQSCMFLADSLDDLGARIVENIDNTDRLNRSQRKLHELASNRYGLEIGTRRLRDVFFAKA